MKYLCKKKLNGQTDHLSTTLIDAKNDLFLNQFQLEHDHLKLKGNENVQKEISKEYFIMKEKLVPSCIIKRR